jgi:hypothetical protein
MDNTRRKFLALALGGAALWTVSGVGAAENTPAAIEGDVVHLTLNVEGMH